MHSETTLSCDKRQLVVVKWERDNSSGPVVQMTFEVHFPSGASVSTTRVLIPLTTIQLDTGEAITPTKDERDMAIDEAISRLDRDDAWE